MTKFYWFAKNLCNIFCTLWFRLEIRGMENLPGEGGLIIVSNHRSYFDPVLLGMRLKRAMRFMAKEELFHNKFFGFLIHHLGAFKVSRGSADMDAVGDAIKTVEQGAALLLFPEGTRSKTGEIMRFKSGAIVIAARSGADVIPACVYMTSGSKFRSRLIVSYGKPISHDELGLDPQNPRTIKQASRRVRDAVCSLYDDIREEHG